MPIDVRTPDVIAHVQKTRVRIDMAEDWQEKGFDIIDRYRGIMINIDGHRMRGTSTYGSFPRTDKVLHDRGHCHEISTRVEP